MRNAFMVAVADFRKQGLSAEQILERLEELSIFFQNVNINYESHKEKEEKQIKNVLVNVLKMPIHISGYQYWIEMISMYRNNKKLTRMELYQLIGEKHKETISSVDRALRYAVKSSYERCSSEEWKAVFGRNVSEKTGSPTNTQFLFTVTELIG